MKKADEQGKEIEALRKRIQFIETRLDDGHALDMARDFTWPEIKNICVKVCVHCTNNQ